MGNPYSNRREYIKAISNVCKYSVGPDSKIKDMAYNIMNNSNTKAKDSLHLASAIYAECDYFITCDDKFIRTVNANRDKLTGIIRTIKLLNPIGFLRYIRNFEEGRGEDYLKVQNEVYKGMSLNEIFKQASDSWQD